MSGPNSDLPMCVPGRLHWHQLPNSNQLLFVTAVSKQRQMCVRGPESNPMRMQRGHNGNLLRNHHRHMCQQSVPQPRRVPAISQLLHMLVLRRLHGHQLRHSVQHMLVKPVPKRRQLRPTAGQLVPVLVSSGLHGQHLLDEHKRLHAQPVS